MNKHPYELAFPYEEHHGDGTLYKDHYGMTLRDYFAAKALMALFMSEANPRVGRDVQPYNNSQDHRDFVAKEAYAIADAMLAARGAA